MRFQPRMLFTLFMAAIFCLVVFTARGWPLGTRLLPWVVGITMLILSLVQLALDLYRSTRSVYTQRDSAETGDLQIDWTISTRLVVRRAANFFGWLVGLVLGIWLLGFFVAVPLFAFFYLKIEAKEGWLLTLLMSGAALLFLIGIFDQILHIHWHQPLVPWPAAMLKRLLPWVN